MRALAIFGFLLALLASAFSQQRFADRRYDIRAGTLVLSSAMYTAGEPNVWYNLDRNSSVKPGGWSFSNPRGASRLSSDMITRWGPGPLGLNLPLPDVNAQLTKADAGYWEVYLSSASDNVLADYDVLLLSARGLISLLPAEREKLRAFVDQGGLLWVDVNSETTFDVANMLAPGFQRGSGVPGSFRANLFHPLLTTPNQIGVPQLGAMMTDQSAGIEPINLASAGLGSIAAIVSPLPYEFDNYAMVSLDASGGLIAVARMGDGYVVVTTRGVATAINRVRLGAGYDANRVFRAQNPTFDSSSNAAGALVINALHLGASYNQPFFGSRKQNSTRTDLGAPLLRTFRAPVTLNLGPRDFVPPATYKGLTFIVATEGANYRLFVYDGLPGNDLDGNGNPDDGIPDPSLGEGLDLLWRSQPLDGPLSSPTAVEVPVFTSPATGNQVVVVDQDGTLLAFDAYATGAGDLLEVGTIYTLDPPNGAAIFDFSVDGKGPYAPTTFEGLAYVADIQPGVGGNSGRVWAVDLGAAALVQTGAVPWSVGGSTAPGIPDISGSATIGYIPVQDNSGAEDLVMYVPSRPNATNLGSQDATAGITSLWIGAKGEKPQDIRESAGTLQVTTRASLQGLRVYTGNDSRGVKISVFHTDPLTGNIVPLTGAELATVFDGSISQGPDGILSFGLIGAWDPGYTLRLSYHIDWGTGVGTVTNQIIRGQLFFPDSSRTRRVLGSVALAPKGNMFVSVGNQVNGGSVYAISEEGRGTFRLLYRYDVFDAHTVSLNQTTPIEYAETFADEDPVNAIVPILSGRLFNLAIQGAPTVKGDTVYVTATGAKTAFAIPMTIVMALDSDPDPIRIPVGNIGTSFNILQPDMARSVNTTIPEIFSVLQPNQYSYERVGEQGTIRITNMMSSTRGIIQQAFSASQPLILRGAGQPDTLIEPNALGGNWSPLLWYTIMHGASTQSPALVTGDTVFVAGNSKLPDILSGVSPLSAVDRGVMFAVRANISPVAPEALSSTNRPWMKQVPVISSVSGTDVDPNDAILWPRPGASMSFEEWQVRYLQSTLKQGDTAYGIAGGDGALYAFGPQRLYGFTRGELMVADEGRLLRMDAAGKLLWSSDMTRTSGEGSSTSATSTVKPLVRPTRAYSLGKEVVVADPGSNRIARLDLTGREVRSITGFQLDPNFRPDGYQAGSPRTFNNPSDISVYSTYVTAGNNTMSSPQPLEYWVHYLIADSGNRRVMELIDRYNVDPVSKQNFGPVEIAGQGQLGVLVWHSPAAVTGKNFAYNSLDKAFNSITNSLVYAAGIGGTQPTRTDLGQQTPAPDSLRESSSGSGGIVLFDENNTEVISQIVMPAIGADVYWSESLGSFSSALTPQRVKPLRGVNSVTMRYISIDNPLDPLNPDTRLAVMFTDSTGVYEVFQPIVGADQPWVVRWMLPREAYKVMRRPGGVVSGANPRDFRPMFARRLDSGEVLMVNGYLGRTRANNEFKGEVLLIDGDFDPAIDLTIPGFDFGKQNFGFSQLSIRLQLTQLENARGIEAPVFADLR
jgi:hypothetical protein